MNQPVKMFDIIFEVIIEFIKKYISNQSAPTILQYWVRIPSTRVCFYIVKLGFFKDFIEKRTKVNKKMLSLAHNLKNKNCNFFIISFAVMHINE